MAGFGRMVRDGGRLAALGASRLGAWGAFGRAHLRSPWQAVLRWPEGKAELGPRVALFVHFDGAGAVRPHTLAYVEALRAAGLSVLFVSNSGRLRPDALDALRPLCAGIIVRRNIGYDFAAMREGLHALSQSRPELELLVIANDSVYGPLHPLAPVLERIDFAQADMWGATESWQRRYHLQSYFLAVGPKVLASPAWLGFWNGVLPVQSKHFVVARYEVGLTQALLRGGLRCAALWPYRSLLREEDHRPVREDDFSDNERDPFLVLRDHHARRVRSAFAHRAPLNPTAELWRQLLDAGFPFIKRELLRDNPAHVQDVADWREVVATLNPSCLALIERDLQRVMKNRSP